MEHLVRFALVILIALAIITSATAAQEPVPANTLTLGTGMSSPNATVGDVAWIAGHWRGDAFGGTAEEIWGGPVGGSMMGSYRMSREGEVVFYELQTIVEHNGSLVFRLKHFNADLSGWEEKQASAAVTFPLVRITPDAAYFDGLTFRKPADGSMQVFLRINRGNNEVVEEKFRYHAVGN